MQAVAVTKLKPNSIQARAKKIADCFLSKGFPYVKVELEANVEPEDYSTESECCDCYGSGRIQCGDCGGAGVTRTTCSICNGKGIIETNNGQTQFCHDCDGGYRESRCQECSGGYVDCSECSGRGYFDNEYWYENYLDDFWAAFNEKLGNTLRLTEHAHIYYDGSVDTEVTLTLRVEYLDELPGIISIFAETCRSFGSCITGNAGLHITLLSDKKYPIEEKLDQKKLSNFRKQVSKLLLGLICLGSPDDSTRAFEFRDLEISSDRKYSAIYTRGDTCIEYRLFDACFDRPSYIIRYLELIGKTLHYYSDDPRRFLKLKDRISLKRSNEILNKAYRGCYRKLADVFGTDESIARLFRELV